MKKKKNTSLSLERGVLPLRLKIPEINQKHDINSFLRPRSLAGYSPRGHKESDTTEGLHLHHDPSTCWKAPVVMVRNMDTE